MGRIPPQALLAENFIMREPGSGTRAALEGYLRQHHLVATSIMQMSSNEVASRRTLTW
ncbi:MAG TPA: hypothetical protein VLK85_32735 [Ramlibacter sp.]|nr:hypothetical protein [Ramlibacter sp.]